MLQYCTRNTFDILVGIDWSILYFESSANQTYKMPLQRSLLKPVTANKQFLLPLRYLNANMEDPDQTAHMRFWSGSSIFACENTKSYMWLPSRDKIFSFKSTSSEPADGKSIKKTWSYRTQPSFPCRSLVWTRSSVCSRMAYMYLTLIRFFTKRIMDYSLVAHALLSIIKFPWPVSYYF